MRLIRFIRSLYLTQPFFIWMGLLIILFVLSHFYPFLFFSSWVFLLVFLLITLVEIIILYRFSKPITAQREVNDKLSNGDINEIKIQV
ncbi:MAG: DUF58 domain-containing protein, partial [Flavobacteriales bacterium]|nr:DUF58 domain-containing protein [Flavobacteriales bacterium]